MKGHRSGVKTPLRLRNVPNCSHEKPVTVQLFNPYFNMKIFLFVTKVIVISYAQCSLLLNALQSLFIFAIKEISLVDIAYMQIDCRYL